MSVIKDVIQLRNHMNAMLSHGYDKDTSAVVDALNDWIMAVNRGEKSADEMPFIWDSILSNGSRVHHIF